MPGVSGKMRRLWQRTGVPAVVLVAAAAMPPTTGAHLAGIPSLCPFHNATGLPCPGCGITRSLVSLMHGRWIDGVHFHPLGPLALALLVGALVVRVARIELPVRFVNGAAIGAVVLLLAVWGARLGGMLPAPP